jgi:hypothetical protein
MKSSKLMTELRRASRLLTGWSLVRIRPGEPLTLEITSLFDAALSLPTRLPQTKLDGISRTPT